MAKTVAFLGGPMHDLVYYVGNMLRMWKEEVLVVSIHEGQEQEYQPNYYMGLDWLNCNYSWLKNHPDMQNSYTYVLIEIAYDQLNVFGVEQEEWDYRIMVTDLHKQNNDQIAKIILQTQKDCMLLVRDICNKRLSSRYFLRMYPECGSLCFVQEIWLDSYDRYYRLCLELEESILLKELSVDMQKALLRIVTDISGYPEEKCKYALQQLKKGVVEC
ncbi:hypothetical protein [Anaerosporobacter faecicola]|uniref:hypothetical protein n=1 Tax=Anaerosporobacter faecicola TaxID=2718714 RepID=UPI0014387D7A|nr:hypothetical protein [Anaerosporobacter faecicola]